MADYGGVPLASPLLTRSWSGKSEWMAWVDGPSVLLEWRASVDGLSQITADLAKYGATLAGREGRKFKHSSLTILQWQYLAQLFPIYGFSI